MKKPCRECPFKRTSAPGYLGECNYDPQAFLFQQQEDLPCHLTVDYEQRKPDLSKSKYCVGNMIFMNNRLKLSRDPNHAKAQQRVGKSDAVFASVAEFINHHKY